MDVLWFMYLPLIFALYVFTKHFFHKLRNLPPTPILNLPFLGHLYLLKRPPYRALAKISKCYGPIVLLQLGSRRVLLAAEECLTKNDVIFANRPHILSGKYLGYNYTSLPWASYGDHWRNLRKFSSTEILSAQRLQILHGVRAEEVKSMIRTLNQASEGRQLVDMKTVLFELTMNVAMRMIVGKRYYGENVEEMDEERRFREIVMDTLRIAPPNIEDVLPLLRWMGVGGMEKELMELRRKSDSFMQEPVEGCKKRFRNYSGGGINGGEVKGKTKTVMEMLLALQEKEPKYYTDEMIRSLMLILLITSTDASAVIMEWALSLLLNNPHVLRNAQIEIDNRIGHDRLIEEADIAELPYLRCIINETLRMYPAGQLFAPHESSQQCTVGGYHIPAGTILLINAWAIHNDPKNWDDAAEFKPERFKGLEGNRDGFKLMPFSSGRRASLCVWWVSDWDLLFSALIGRELGKNWLT